MELANLNIHRGDQSDLPRVPQRQNPQANQRAIQPPRDTLTLIARHPVGKFLGGPTVKIAAGVMIGLGIAMGFTGVGMAVMAAGVGLWVLSTAIQVRGRDPGVSVARHVALAVLAGSIGIAFSAIFPLAGVLSVTNSAFVGAGAISLSAIFESDWRVSQYHQGHRWVPVGIPVEPDVRFRAIEGRTSHHILLNLRDKFADCDSISTNFVGRDGRTKCLKLNVGEKGCDFISGTDIQESVQEWVAVPATGIDAEIAIYDLHERGSIFNQDNQLRLPLNATSREPVDQDRILQGRKLLRLLNTPNWTKDTSSRQFQESPPRVEVVQEAAETE